MAKKKRRNPKKAQQARERKLMATVRPTNPHVVYKPDTRRIHDRDLHARIGPAVPIEDPDEGRWG